MNNDDLPGFTETCRLFPLPGLVLFPHAVLPLHIFEPRYRQMTEDALSTDNLITMVQMKAGGAPGAYLEPTPIEEVGCLGKIIRYERLPDNRFNLLLVGLKRVRIPSDLPAEKPYRIAAAEIIEDIPTEQPEAPWGDGLVRLFRKEFEQERSLDPDLRKLLDSDTIALGALTDIIAHALEMPAHFKQTLLSESSVDRRALLLMKALGEREHGRSTSVTRTFPPPFSQN